MVSMKCPVCAKRIIWDDFQPDVVHCPDCGTAINVHGGLRDNIRQREMEAEAAVTRCPHCAGPVARRWFIKCPHCGYWLFGAGSIHSRWPFFISLSLAYLALTLYYILVVH